MGNGQSEEGSCSKLHLPEGSSVTTFVRPEPLECGTELIDLHGTNHMLKSGS